MSTSSVSSPKNRGNRYNPAKWDDDRTRILLEVFVDEIDNGNRPSGVFSKQGWINIVQNFNERTGLNWNKDQLKNRQDNLRREFSKWEKLIGKETGFGWDHEKQTLSAPYLWWEERAKSDPNILKYRDSGPLHLELLQRVFCGITATGYYSYIPEENTDPLLNSGDVLETQSDGVDGTQPHNEYVPKIGSIPPDEATDSPRPSGSSLRGAKRKRLSSSSRLSASDKFHNSMDSLTSTVNRGIDKYNPMQVVEHDTTSYKEVLEQLKGLPGMNCHNPIYLKGVRILTDILNRVAFYRLLEEGPDAVVAWIDSYI